MLTVRSEIGPYRRRNPAFPSEQIIHNKWDGTDLSVEALAKAEPVPPIIGDAGPLALLKLKNCVLTDRNLFHGSANFGVGRLKKPWRAAACRRESYPSRCGDSQRRSPSASSTARCFGLS